ncbi:conserved hypothetical protein [uncultured spirochete]|uniref:SMP-30/Gluconolactonase/LRE-like region domain-containing protein n=1 Tax=uncultured spirochete TaxID=156406 RepID=A0A3P3XNG5_9SPIR|nr:conserved hypothetical protein [uncultured spirochete]
MLNKNYVSPKLSFPEGPVLMDNGDFFLVEMGEDAGTISHIDGKTFTCTRVVKTGRPNGLAIDKDGTIWCAESKHPSLLKVTQDGKVEMVLEKCEGEDFRFPNDLAFGPDGMLYMTDSGIRFYDSETNGKLNPDYMTYPYRGKVYCINPKTLEIYKIDDYIKFTNGIALGPDDRLYVNETRTGNIYSYGKVNGRYSNKDKKLFANVLHEGENLSPSRGPDGMKFAASGNLYCVVYGQWDVVVLDRNGKQIKYIPTEGQNPTNLVFGPQGSGDIYVTEVAEGHMEKHHVGEDGMVLYR